MLKRLPKEHDQWFVNARLSELDVAHDWGIPPHVWDTYPEESRAEMIARAQVKAGMERYSTWWAERKREAQAPKGKRR